MWADSPEKDSHLRGKSFHCLRVGPLRLLRETLVHIHPLPALQTAWKFLLKSLGENTPEENNIHVDSIHCFIRRSEFLDQPILGKRTKCRWLLNGMILRVTGFGLELPLVGFCLGTWLQSRERVSRDLSLKKAIIPLPTSALLLFGESRKLQRVTHLHGVHQEIFLC